MPLELVDFERKTRNAVQAFWQTRADAHTKQLVSGKIDQGERSGVTSGKNMDEFIRLLIDLVRANGLSQAQIHQKRALLTLPGYFRPTKLWDFLVIHQGELVAAVEFKSQVGPSFGNNFNNRAEEAIGTAHDFWTAYRNGALGTQPHPFAGWLMLVEDAPESRSSVKDSSPHFQVFNEFSGASYLKRYDLLCQKLVHEQLYTAATIIATPRTAIETGEFSHISPMTDLKTFVTTFAGHIAATAARMG